MNADERAQHIFNIICAGERCDMTDIEMIKSEILGAEAAATMTERKRCAEICRKYQSERMDEGYYPIPETSIDQQNRAAHDAAGSCAKRIMEETP
mgnify:CR=1 FL=1